MRFSLFNNYDDLSSKKKPLNDDDENVSSQYTPKVLYIYKWQNKKVENLIATLST